MEFIIITKCDQRITLKQVIKYLGVVIDNRLPFRKHLTYFGGKYAAASCALARIMPNLGCPKQGKWLEVWRMKLGLVRMRSTS